MGKYRIMGKYFVERTIRVYLTCTGDWVDEKTVKVENIEEDMQGQDVLTFTCPECKQTHKSLRRG